MKWIYFPLTLVVLMAGVYFGLQDYKRSLDRRPPPLPEDGPRVGEETPRQTEPVVPDLALDVQALALRIREALAVFEELLEQDKLEQAARAAEGALRTIAGDLGPAIDADERGLEALGPLRILLVRARLYRSVEGLERSDTLPITFFRVKLANGNTLTARRADLKGDRYEIETAPHGIIFTQPREKIASVIAVDRKDYLEDEWKRLSSRLEGLRDPVDLYVKGVSKCVSMGLKKEGFRLLARVLDAPTAAGVIDVVFLDASPPFRRLWAQATGAAPLPPVPGIATTEPPPREVVSVPAGNPEATPDGSTGPATEPLQPVSVSREELTTTLATVKTLREEARTIYREAISGNTELSTLSAARTKLERARDLLRNLPRDSSSVQANKAEVFSLLHAVIKAQPF